jgi:hypothetical protein
MTSNPSHSSQDSPGPPVNRRSIQSHITTYMSTVQLSTLNILVNGPLQTSEKPQKVVLIDPCYHSF